MWKNFGRIRGDVIEDLTQYSVGGVIPCTGDVSTFVLFSILTKGNLPYGYDQV